MGAEILKEDFTSQAAVDSVELSKAVKVDQPDIDQTLDVEETVDSTQETDEVASENVAAEANNDSFPKDAVEDWPAPKQIHTFYFVKYQPHEDPKLRAKFEQVDKEIQKRNKERSQIVDALKEKRAERSQIISQLKPLTAEDKQFRTVMDEKRREMEPLHAALGKLRDANNTERGMGICSSEDELNSFIKSLEYRIQHESNTLTEEKQLLKEIKNLEGTRDKVIAYAAMKAQLQDLLGPKEAIQDQVKLIGVGLDGVRKEKNANRSRIKSLEDVLKALDDEISALQEELTSVTQKRDKTYEMRNELFKSRDEGNASFHQYRSILNTARDLAVKKDVVTLKELCTSEVTKFISQWSTDKAFRDDYEKRILPSLDRRLLSRDGRMRNPDEKPIFAETSAPVIASESTAVPKPLPVKKDERVDAVVAPKEESEKPAGVRAKAADDSDDFVLPQKPAAPVVAAAAVDSEKLKEMKKEEEIAKARLAQERKKRLAEKAAAKAEARAQKEAEKKQKEREKRAKRKVDGAVDQSESKETAEETQESDEPKETVPASMTKAPKGNLKNRGRVRVPEGRPKFVIPKRKKAQPYLKWAAFASAFILLLAVVGFYFYYYFPSGRN